MAGGETLGAITPGLRILDAGADELRHKPLCAHLDYVSQDFCQYEGTGEAQCRHTGKCDTIKIDLVCGTVNIPEPDTSFDVILCSEVIGHLILLPKLFFKPVLPNCLFGAL